MGIRFTCPDCTKRLNVKAFLAGKRGICPHCGAKVEIPYQTQPEEAAAAPTAAPRSVAGARLGGMNGSAAPAMPAVPMHASPDGNGQAATATAQPAAPVSAAPMSAAPVARAVTAAPASAPAVESPPPERPRDPIDEAPHAVWYVRPPTGGQYGPASGEIMRKWVGEGRVSGDSLIWREGWADWKTAASQFPEIGGGPGGASAPPPPAGITNPVITSPAAATDSPASPVRTYPRRRNNNSLAMVLVIVLTLAALGLLGLFFAVITWLG